MPLEKEIEYPTSDGQPMAETTIHRKVMSNLIGGLERRYADTADVWAGGNLLLYYLKGRPDKSVSPDVMLARGVKSKHDRDTWLLWEEGVPPALVFEITSRSTCREDTGRKKDLYERLGVSELVLFDPYAEYLKPRLQGYRLDQGRYRPIPPNSDGSLALQTTGLTARPEGERLRLVDTASGEKLLWEEEMAGVLQEVDTARREAEERAAAAEERARRLEEELARLRG
ncbi:MAG TPA: Uma2 family endonuclease [Thermoanaerobaculia bacterium]|nr:Uma2 family endonuclease [Thermoanaerobaculia bacterium]